MAPLHVNLHGQQKRKQELVFLIKSTAGNTPDLVCQVLDDVCDAIAGDGTLVRPVNNSSVSIKPCKQQ